MEMSSKKTYEILKEKGVSHIFHANSVITATQFLRRGSLLSRGSIERENLYQSVQQSDKLDKRYGLWFDVFTDSVDIHKRANKKNVYGPVLFVIDIEMLNDSYTGKLWVTKRNPVKWNAIADADRWFSSTTDLKENFKLGEFDHMVVFRHCGGELPIRNHLEKIILDDPGLETVPSKIDYFSMAYGALKLAMTEGSLSVPIDKRECRNGCRCRSEYEENNSHTKSMFFPRIYKME